MGFVEPDLYHLAVVREPGPSVEGEPGDLLLDVL
jgi:hypothetical protein